MSEWRTKADQDLTAVDVAAMRAAAASALITDEAELPGTLFGIIDQLWGHLTAEQVRDIERDTPQIASVCRKVHELLWHGND